MCLGVSSEAKFFVSFLMAEKTVLFPNDTHSIYRKQSDVNMEDEIDDDIELLEQNTSRSLSDDIDFVNLDQLGNTIGSKKSKDRKHTIVDVLNQTIKHQKALTCIDNTIKLVLDTWPTKELRNKRAEDLYAILQEKKYKLLFWEELISYFYDKPSFICTKLIRIAKRIVLFIINYPFFIHCLFKIIYK